MRSEANGKILITALDKTYEPTKERVAVSGSKSWDGDGGLSIRNTDR